MLATAEADQRQRRTAGDAGRRRQLDGNHSVRSRGSKTSGPTSWISRTSTSAWSALTTAALPKEACRRTISRPAASFPPAPAPSATSATSPPTSRSSSARTASAAWTASPQCPDTAILGKVAEPATLEQHLAGFTDEDRAPDMAAQWAITNKYFNVLEKKGVGGGKFGIFIDPTKCKGCAECVDACGDHDALKMIRKNDENMKWYRHGLRLLQVHARDADEIHQRESPGGHDAGRALAALRGRRRVVHGLRRSHGAAHDACRDRLRLRPGKHRHRGRHRLQHRLHVHLSLQSVPRFVDQFAVRERAGRRHGRARALGPDGLAEQAPVDRRRRRRHERHRLPVALAHAGVRAWTSRSSCSTRRSTPIPAARRPPVRSRARTPR